VLGFLPWRLGQPKGSQGTRWWGWHTLVLCHGMELWHQRQHGWEAAVGGDHTQGPAWWQGVGTSAIKARYSKCSRKS